MIMLQLVRVVADVGAELKRATFLGELGKKKLNTARRFPQKRQDFGIPELSISDSSPPPYEHIYIYTHVCTPRKTVYEKKGMGYSISLKYYYCVVSELGLPSSAGLYRGLLFSERVPWRVITSNLVLCKLKNLVL